MSTSTSTTVTSPTSNAKRGRRKNVPAARQNKATAKVAEVDETASSEGVSTPGLATPLIASIESEQEEQETCWICAEAIKYYSVSQCNHRTCHRCALRLRALYKRTDCAFCKHPQPSLIFTESPTLAFEAFTPNMIPFSDPKLAISFETQEMMTESLLLLRFNCPDQECDYIGRGWPDLKWHVREVHNMVLCDLCIRHKKIFCHEHTLYPPSLLPTHLPSLKRQRQYNSHHPQSGTDEPTSQEVPHEHDKEIPPQGVDFIHPICSFCRECFFGDDELYAHLREKHEECFVCRRQGITHVYYLNYEKLEDHFRISHYQCTNPACLEQKFVVFSSALDLQIHQVEVHGESMTGREKKEARRIEAEFTFSDGAGAGGTRRGGHAHEGANRGGSRRAEFGGRLTANPPPASEAPGHVNETEPPDPVQIGIPPDLVSFLASILSSRSALLSISASVRAYRSGESTVRDMLDAIYSVFDRNAEPMGKFVTRLVDTGALTITGGDEAQMKKDGERRNREVLETWGGIRAQERQQFPSLAPLAADAFGSNGDYAGISSGRVINVKRHTAPSHASTSGRNLWDRVEQVANSSTVPGANRGKPGVVTSFPALSSAASSSRGGGARQTPWAGTSTVSSIPSAFPSLPPTSSQAPTSQPARKQAPTPSKPTPPPPSTSSNSQFPTLPQPSRPTVPRELIQGNQSAKNIRGVDSSTNRWTSGDKLGSTDNKAGEDSSGGGKGKKKKGKETLFTLGSFGP